MGAKAHGLTELETDLKTAADTVLEQGKRVVGQGCLNIKRQAKSIIRGVSRRGYLPHYPRSISYDVTAGGGVIVGDVGPDRVKLQGGLGRILEYGTVNNSPIPHLSPSLDAEEPRFVHYVGELGAALLNGRPGPAGPVVDPGGGS